MALKKLLRDNDDNKATGEEVQAEKWNCCCWSKGPEKMLTPLLRSDLSAGRYPLVCLGRACVAFEVAFAQSASQWIKLLIQLVPDRFQNHCRTDTALS